MTGRVQRLAPAPEPERFRRLLHEHPETIGCDSRAFPRPPVDERRWPRSVGGVVSHRHRYAGYPGQGREITG